VAAVILVSIHRAVMTVSVPTGFNMTETTPTLAAVGLSSHCLFIDRL